MLFRNSTFQRPGRRQWNFNETDCKGLRANKWTGNEGSSSKIMTITLKDKRITVPTPYSGCMEEICTCRYDDVQPNSKHSMLTCPTQDYALCIVLSSSHIKSVCTSMIPVLHTKETEFRNVKKTCSEEDTVMEDKISTEREQSWESKIEKSITRNSKIQATTMSSAKSRSRPLFAHHPPGTGTFLTRCHNKP